jgi:glycosyltransferase involved in cell wall biosynthesis
MIRPSRADDFEHARAHGVRVQGTRRRPIIAIDFSTLDYLNLGSGQYRYVVNLVSGLSRLRTGMDFLLIGSRPSPVAELKPIFESGDHNWKYVRVRHSDGRGAFWKDQLKYAVLLRRTRVDLLHALHSFIPTYAPCPVVVTCHDLTGEIFPDYAEALRSRPYRRFRRAVQEHVSRVLCSSATTSRDLQRLFGVDPARHDVVPLGINRPELNGAGEVEPLLLKDLEPLDWDRVLLSPYNLEPRKNLHALLEAVAILKSRYKNLKLILFGRAAATKEREEQFELKLCSLKLQDVVSRVGFVSDAQLSLLYSRSALFVYPSLYEGFGLPILESMACGTCVVARNASAMAELVDGAGALVETRDPPELAREIATLLDDSARRSDLGQRARERSAQFSVERMAQLTLQSYLKTLRGGAAGAR